MLTLFNVSAPLFPENPRHFEVSLRNTHNRFIACGGIDESIVGVSPQRVWGSRNCHLEFAKKPLLRGMQNCLAVIKKIGPSFFAEWTFFRNFAPDENSFPCCSAHEWAGQDDCQPRLDVVVRAGGLPRAAFQVWA